MKRNTYRKVSHLLSLRTIFQTLSFLCLSTYTGNAQTIERQVIASLGITSSGVSSTLGEVMIQTLSSDGLTLNQGFHQPTVATAEPPPPPLGISEMSRHLTIYPNPIPVNGKLNIEIDKQYVEVLELDIVTLDGKRIVHHTHLFTKGQRQEIDLRNIPAGQYTLLLYSKYREHLVGMQKILVTD